MLWPDFIKDHSKKGFCKELPERMYLRLDRFLEKSRGYFKNLNSEKKRLKKQSARFQVEVVCQGAISQIQTQDLVLYQLIALSKRLEAKLN